MWFMLYVADDKKNIENPFIYGKFKDTTFFKNPSHVKTAWINCSSFGSLVDSVINILFRLRDPEDWGTGVRCGAVHTGHPSHPQ